MANVSNFIKVTKAQYDILVNGGSITKDGTTYTYDNNALYLVEEDFSYLYNSGKFDLYPYNSDRSKVLRQTGYVDLGSLNWEVWGSATSGYKYIAPLNFAYEYVGNYTLPYLVTNDKNYPVVIRDTWMSASSVSDNGITLTISGEGYQVILCSTTISSVNDLISYLQANQVMAQIKLATSYIDPVIENQPLLTLDQNGCNFLRQEWEKGLNLWQGFEYLNLNSADGSITPSASNLSSNYIPVKPNTTYTYDNYPTSVNNIVAYYTSSKTYIERTSGGAYGTRTFTTPSNCYYVAIGMVGSLTTAQITEALTHNIMLNEGSHPYPYQERYGRLLHEKDIEAESIPQGTVNETLGYDTDGKLVRGTAGGGGSSKHTHYLEVIYNADSNNRFRIYFTIVSDRDTPYTSFTEIYDYFNGLTTSTMRISANGDATVSQAVNHVSALSFVFAYSQIWLIGFSGGSDGILRQDLKSLTTFSDFTDIVD